MTGEKIEIEGLAKLARQCKKLGDELVTATRVVNLEAANLIAADARGRAPRRTGRLAGSIRAGATRTAATVRVGSKTVPYAAPIHWGWHRHHIKPNPFLYHALDARRGEVVELYAKRVVELEGKAFP